MPDTRSHRGPHPEDAKLFAPAALPSLQSAHADLCWLLDRGYAKNSALALVGNRFNLAQRQRVAVARCSCTAGERVARRERENPLAAAAGADLWIDGYNLLIGIESALGGGVVLHGRDGCFRDLASLHGTYRAVEETTPALTLIGESLAAAGVARSHWILDRPVSNSGRLKTLMLELAAQRGWTWDVQLEFSPDKFLTTKKELVATSDSFVLDHCGPWVNAASAIIRSRMPAARIVDLGGEAAARREPADRRGAD